jgi:colanic acid/amylovoran biosynthesis glycosyltransferase
MNPVFNNHHTVSSADNTNGAHTKGRKVAYILKMYPRFSETFIVNEMLAHEAAGTTVEIFSLRLPVDGRFHEQYARVQANVTYIPQEGLKTSSFWQVFQPALKEFPELTGLVQAEEFAADELCQAIHLARAVHNRGFDALHAHFGSIATSVARVVSRLTGIPYLFTAHAKDIFHKSVDPTDLRRKVQEAAAVITVSDYNVQYLRQQLGDPLPNLHRIYNGLDLTRFLYQDPAARPRRILGVGRLIEKKGFDILIDACALLVQQGVRFHCDIVGDGERRQALATQIARLGLEDRVHLCGPEPQEMVIRRLQQAAVFAAPCVVGDDGNRDGLPTVLLEAMALGTPSVSTDVTGIPEILHHEETGLQVAQENAQDLAGALARLLDDADLRVRLAGNARRLIEDRFDIHKNSAQIRRLYAQAANPLPLIAQKEVA